MVGSPRESFLQFQTLFGYVALILIVPVTSYDFKIAYTGNLQGASQYVAGAVAYAVNQASEMGVVGPEHSLNFKYISADKLVDPDKTTLVKEMIEMHIGDNCVIPSVNAYIGPDTPSCYQEAFVATAINIPMISFVSTISIFIVGVFAKHLIIFNSEYLRCNDV